VGILTQRDILTRVILLQKNAVRTPAADVMSTPILPIPPDYSVFTASRIMHKMRIHRLVVQDGRRICGIVSQTDILHALEKKLAEEEKHRMFLLCSDIPMFMLDAVGVITYVNAAFVKLFNAKSPEQVVGSAFSDAGFWASAEDRERLLALLSKKQSRMRGLVALTRTGKLKRIVLLLTATRNACDELAGWQGVAWHMTGKTPKTMVCHGAADSTAAEVLPDV
jgi:PAS domain-containing protein